MVNTNTNTTSTDEDFCPECEGEGFVEWVRGDQSFADPCPECNGDAEDTRTRRWANGRWHALRPTALRW